MLHPVLIRRQDVGGAASITTWMSCRWRAKSLYRLRSPKNGVWGRMPPAAWGLSGGVGGSTPPDKRVLRKTTLFIKNEESLNGNHVQNKKQKIFLTKVSTARISPNSPTGQAL